MIHFIPAWYQKNKWCENEQKWYSARLRTEFDDTVKQIQLFHRNKVYPFQIMLFSYAPNFRHFLHRQGVYRVHYWSCFDAIQNITRKKTRILSFYNLNWPEEIEFIYTPFVVLAFLEGKKYAQIEFGEAGNPIQVDMYKNEIIERRNFYDDRGFVSSTVLYEAGKAVHQDYLTDKGIWKLREYFQDGHVEINPKVPTYILEYQDKIVEKEFLLTSYEKLESIILEVVSNYVSLLKKEDLFCAAMDEKHNKILYEVLKNRSPILSFYEKRCKIIEDPIILSLIKNAGYIVTDTLDKIIDIENLHSGYKGVVKDISPFDTRLSFGISQQINKQKIMVPIDGMKEEKFEKLIYELGLYLEKNSKVQIHLFTRKSDYNREILLLKKTQEYLEKYKMNPEWAMLEKRDVEQENNIDQLDTVKRFFVEQCVEDYKVSNCMMEQRLLLDVREESEVFLQVLAISVGIPQLVTKETQFLCNGKNGFLITEGESLEKYLDYYLIGLSNWNKSMIYCYEIGKRYNANVLVEKWREVIDSVRGN